MSVFVTRIILVSIQYLCKLNALIGSTWQMFPSSFYYRRSGALVLLDNSTSYRLNIYPWRGEYIYFIEIKLYFWRRSFGPNSLNLCFKTCQFLSICQCQFFYIIEKWDKKRKITRYTYILSKFVGRLKVLNYLRVKIMFVDIDSMKWIEVNLLHLLRIV